MLFSFTGLGNVFTLNVLKIMFGEVAALEFGCMDSESSN